MKLSCLNAALGVILACVSLHPAKAGNLNSPANLIFIDGKLFVANLLDGNILVYDGGNVVETITTGGEPDRLALDTKQHLFVEFFTANMVREYTLKGKLLKTVNKAGGFGLAADAYDDLIVVPTPGARVFNEYDKKVKSYTNDFQGLPFDGGAAAISGQTLYYANGPTQNTSTLATYNVGNFITGWPVETGAFSNNGSALPTQIAVDSAGNIYVAGLAGNMVKYSPSGSVLLTLTGFAQAGGVAIDGSGNIYVSEAQANDIKIFNASGVLTGTLD
jgi:sugar lactone lactonase YvrE